MCVLTPAALKLLDTWSCGSRGVKSFKTDDRFGISEARNSWHAAMIKLSIGPEGHHDGVDGQMIKTFSLMRHSHPCFAHLQSLNLFQPPQNRNLVP